MHRCSHETQLQCSGKHMRPKLVPAGRLALRWQCAAHKFHRIIGTMRQRVPCLEESALIHTRQNVVQMRTHTSRKARRANTPSTLPLCFLLQFQCCFISPFFYHAIVRKSQNCFSPLRKTKVKIDRQTETLQSVFSATYTVVSHFFLCWWQHM